MGVVEGEPEGLRVELPLPLCDTEPVPLPLRHVEGRAEAVREAQPEALPLRVAARATCCASANCWSWACACR